VRITLPTTATYAVDFKIGVYSNSSGVEVHFHYSNTNDYITTWSQSDYQGGPDNGLVGEGATTSTTEIDISGSAICYAHYLYISFVNTGANEKVDVILYEIQATTVT
jgi:hypothetical protein